MRKRLTGVGRWGVVAVCGAMGLAQAQTAPPKNTGRLLVLSKRAHTLAIVNPRTLQVEAKIPVGDDPHEVIASADGRTAWVSNYGFGAFHTLAVADLAAWRALPAVELGPLGGAHGLAVSQGKVWFTTELAKAVGRYDPVTKKVDLVIGDGQDRTHMVWVTPDGQQVIATNVNSGTVSFLEQVDRVAPPGPPPSLGAPAGGAPPAPTRPMKDWEQTLVRVGRGSEGFDVSPDGRLVWVGNAGDGTVSIIDRASRQLLETLPLNVNGVNRLKFTPDGKFVLLSGVRGEEPLWVVDADSHQVVKKLRVGKGSAGILMEPGGRRAFVACSPDNFVAVIDLTSMAVVGRIDAGAEPDGMAWAASGR